jgi:dTDP-4-dehydrorhamnose 3,5-epimerase
MTGGRFDVLRTPIDGLVILTRKPVGDQRGFLERLYCANDLRDVTGGLPIAQINRTLTSARGTVRGMHFQHPPHAELKLVTCLRGEVFDVAVDLRVGSPTFLRWHSVLLTEDNATTFVIPRGFAHGFQTMTDDCELLYVHSAAYRAEAEGGLNPRDPRLGIAWPSPITDLSERDASHPMITEQFRGIAL